MKILVIDDDHLVRYTLSKILSSNGYEVVTASDGKLVVGRVASDGPGDKAGVRHGDRVTAIDGTPVGDLAGFYRSLWRLGDAGVTVKLNVSRQGREQEIEIRTIDRYRYLKLDTTY